MSTNYSSDFIIIFTVCSLVHVHCTVLMILYVVHQYYILCWQFTLLVILFSIGLWCKWRVILQRISSSHQGFWKCFVRFSGMISSSCWTLHSLPSTKVKFIWYEIWFRDFWTMALHIGREWNNLSSTNVLSLWRWQLYNSLELVTRSTVIFSRVLHVHRCH